MKWAEMSPEQRDASIAEHVFGWQYIPAGRYGPHVKEGTIWLLPERGLLGIHSDVSADWLSIGEDKYIPRNWIPRYTTSMDAAWQITELERFSHIEVMRYHIGDLLDPEYKYDCRLIIFGGQMFHSYGSTPQEAICLAALNAAGVKFGDDDES